MLLAVEPIFDGTPDDQATATHTPVSYIIDYVCVVVACIQEAMREANTLTAGALSVPQCQQHRAQYIAHIRRLTYVQGGTVLQGEAGTLGNSVVWSDI